MALRVFANQLWTVGRIPRTWLIRWDGCLQAAGAAWVGLPAPQRFAWAAYGRLVEAWDAWHCEVETVSVPDRARPFPQFYGATAIWSACVGAPAPGAAPVVRQFPGNDVVVLAVSAAAPAPPSPLRAHVYATWLAPGGWGGAVVYAVVFARSTVPLQASNKFWRSRGFGGVILIRPGVPVCLDALLVAAETRGASPSSWLRLALVEPGLVPFYVGPQIVGSWFTP